MAGSDCRARQRDAGQLGGIPALKDLIRVSEIFGPTIQGEGPLIGRPTVFVRTGGCDYRCAWCDTLYAVLPSHRDEWLPMSTAEIAERVDALTGSQPILVTLSGGNPAMQPLGPLIALGRSKGYSFALETQGSLAPDWLAHDAHIDRAQVASVLRDLANAKLIVAHDGLYRLTTNPRDRAAIEQFAETYNARPVTLIRAVYARPSPLRSFADAFRLRREE